MKLLIAIVRDADALQVTDQLVENHYRVTRIASTGGFLRRGNVTLLVGVEAEQISSVCDIITGACSEPDPGQHKATIFILPAEDFLQIG